MSARLLEAGLREAIAEDLETLAHLQSGELEAGAIDALRALRFPDNLGLLPRSEAALSAAGAMRRAVEMLETGERCMDALAADFAAIYLNGQLSASPCESVWLDDDHLAFQGPMFELREIYRRHGFEAEDWRRRPEDHLVLQLQFLARWLRRVISPEDLGALAAFLDEHPLRWIARFASRVAQRCATDFYRGLALLTAAYLDQLRGLLAEDLGVPRPSPEEIDACCNRGKSVEAVPVRFVPGVAPSW